MIRFVSCFIAFTFYLLRQSAQSQLESKCSSDQKRFNEIIKNEKALDVFYFKNDTKKTIQLTWAGENIGVLILVTMTESDTGPGLTSDIYRSDNNGKTFVKITDDLGEKVYIRREHGLQRQQNQKDSKELFLICYDVENKNHSLIFVTNDGGVTWKKSQVPFVLSGQLIFYPRQRLSRRILTLEEKTYRLFLSIDSGKSWVNVRDDVVDFFWSIYESDPDETLYVVTNTGVTKNETVNQTLLKSTDLGRTWTHVMDHVVRVWAPRGILTKTAKYTQHPNRVDNAKNTQLTGVTESTPLSTEAGKEVRRSGRFLYVAHLTDLENQTTQLSVSVNGGRSFRPVYLPSIQPDRFYSVLEVEDDLAFVHVDAPNDTGHGTLYTSESSGQILTESLRHHLYPNHAPVTDFYRIASMRGTYLTTRMNPKRTLYSVITHDRGATWRPLDVPLNVENGCKTDVSSVSNGKQSTSTTSRYSVQHADETTESVKGNTSKSVTGDTTWDNFSASDLSSAGVCGLQISSQFSIRNRVIASAPLSISAAPGLILVHGHVATHLKNTPADLFVSSDGGYSWNKALDGPHHCQIANRGALLVAVPADTLWPEVLRFSTDEGRCWHTIPLRSGTFHVDQSEHTTPIVDVHIQDTTTTTTESPVARLSTTLVSAELSNQNTTSAEDFDSMIPTMRDETVVFAGLVTEPGGRAMAAAVYGYGTGSQHWRVAVVDFITNGMVTNDCTSEDYETWMPHASSGDTEDGCLLGVKQYFKRLKKDALCVNDYGLDPLIHSTTCPCTAADFECDYGYSRSMGSMECIRDAKVPLLHPCLLLSVDRNRTIYSGYRRIPGDQCEGGWHPPYLNETTRHELLTCSDDIQKISPVQSRRSSIGVSAVALTVALTLILCLSAFCYQRNKRSLYSTSNVSRLSSRATGNRFGYFVSPWKRIGGSGHVGTHGVLGNHDISWPPVSHSGRWNFTQMDANGHGTESFISSCNRNAGEKKDNFKQTGLPRTRDYFPHRSHVRPAFLDRFRQNEPDVTGLIGAEEVAFPIDPSEETMPTEFFTVSFHDPLAHSHSTIKKNQNVA